MILGLALSTHLGVTNEYNSIHPHIRFLEGSTISGLYYNSINRLSWYGGINIPTGENFSFEIGGVTGYTTFDKVSPYIRGIYNTENLKMFIAPAYERNRTGNIKTGIVIGVEIPIGK